MGGSSTNTNCYEHVHHNLRSVTTRRRESVMNVKNNGRKGVQALKVKSLLVKKGADYNFINGHLRHFQVISFFCGGRSFRTTMTSDKFHYFAYGSNLLSERILLNNKSAVMKSIGLLQGYRLEFAYMSKRWKGAAANIFPDPTSNVYGVLWELNIEDMTSLNKQEGVDDGIYERLDIQVESEGKIVNCSVYKLTDQCREQSIATHGESLKPSTVYKNVIIRGAKENNLPQEYIKQLENIPCNGYTGQVEVNLSLSQQ